MTKRQLELVLCEEDLSLTIALDNDEPDELTLIPANKKTKLDGYLKDGWILEDNEFICTECDKIFKKKKKDILNLDLCKKCYK